MSLFENLCENYFEEMAAPKRGKIGIPGAAANPPGFARKEKFGGQAGKYTGAQMLGFLGEFLTDNAERELDYSEMQGLLDTFLKRKGFGGTAAKYWTRTLGQAIYDFGYKPEKPSEITDGKGEQPEEFESDEVPEITDSEQTPETSEEAPSEAPQEVPEEKLDYMSSKVVQYLKEGEATVDEIASYLSKSEVKMAIDKLQSQSKEFGLNQADKEDAINKVVSKTKKEIEVAIQKLIKTGKIEDLGEGKYALVRDEKEGEGSGELPLIDKDGESDDEEVINKYRSEWGDTATRGNPFLEDSVDLKVIYKDIFKSLSVIKD